MSSLYAGISGGVVGFVASIEPMAISDAGFWLAIIINLFAVTAYGHEVKKENRR